MTDLANKVNDTLRQNPFLSSYMAVVQTIKEEICACRIKPGTHLKEIDMAEKMEVSRSTIRHAFDVLILDGTVVRREYGGVEVAPMHKRRYLDLVEIRVMLDAFSARLAAIRRTEPDLEEMKYYIARFMESRDSEQMTQADISFHYCIYRATKNSAILRVYDDCSLEIIRSKYITVPAILYIRERIISEHMSIYEAILQQNPQLAFNRGMNHANILYDPLLTSYAFD